MNLLLPTRPVSGWLLDQFESKVIVQGNPSREYILPLTQNSSQPFSLQLPKKRGLNQFKAINELLSIRKEVSEAIASQTRYARVSPNSFLLENTYRNKDAISLSTQTGLKLSDAISFLEKHDGSLSDALVAWMMN